MVEYRMIFSDCHAHIKDFSPADFSLLRNENYAVCFSLNSRTEFGLVGDLQLKFLNIDMSGTGPLFKEPYFDIAKLCSSYGVLPQTAVQDSLEECEIDLNFLEKLLEDGKTENHTFINAIGECGLDFRNALYREKAREQEIIFERQIELAIKYQKSLVIHCVKAFDKIFEKVDLLKKVPAVVFHSFSQDFQCAKSLRSRGVNAYFCFGKNLFQNRKSVLECAKLLPLEWILTETDCCAQNSVALTDIKAVVERLSFLRGAAHNETAAHSTIVAHDCAQNGLSPNGTAFSPDAIKQNAADFAQGENPRNCAQNDLCQQLYRNFCNVYE